MIRLRSFILLLLIYVISFVSLRYNINILYPYYYLKDLLLSPVYALIKDDTITLNNDLEQSVIASLQEEINELKNLSDITLVLSDFNYLNATVIERNREYWFNSLTINKGSSDGIMVDMAVIDSNGLVGRIESVNKHSSTVKLLTTNDVLNKMSVTVKASEDAYGITSGYDAKEKLLKVILYNDDIKINEGMKVETTGMGGIFPRGILIGYVYDLLKSSDGVSTIVRIKLAGNLEGEKYVRILQRKDDTNS